MNYWTAYNGTDNDGDGIGDSAHYYHDILQDSHQLIGPVPIIPEFPSWIRLPLFLIITLAALSIKKKIDNQVHNKTITLILFFWEKFNQEIEKIISKTLEKPNLKIATQRNKLLRSQN